MSNSVHSCAISERSCTASRTMIGRRPRLLASVAVARTQALVEQPVMSRVSTRRSTRRPISGVPAKALACSLAMTYSPGWERTRSSISQARRSHLRNFGEKSAADLKGCAPSVHVDVAKKGVEAGAKVIEAPMASSVTHAREGKLFFMLAGDRAVIEESEPLLKDLSVKMKYVGGAGKAAELKALVNMVMNINTAGLAEGLGLADALGLDLKVVSEVFSQTGANSRVLETDGPDMLDREHSTFFSAAHAAKDSGIALSLAAEQGLNLPLLEASKRQYDRMIELGLGEIDKSGISELTFHSRRG